MTRRQDILDFIKKYDLKLIPQLTIEYYYKNRFNKVRLEKDIKSIELAMKHYKIPNESIPKFAEQKELIKFILKKLA
jgi:hypothetical protein